MVKRAKISAGKELGAGGEKYPNEVALQDQQGKGGKPRLGVPSQQGLRADKRGSALRSGNTDSAAKKEGGRAVRCTEGKN